MAQTDYKKIYMQESEELLQQMNEGLLALEKKSDDSNALNSIFRSAHTLKSMSAAMGYRKIADLAHKMEDLLSMLRSKTVAVSSEIVDLLFKSFDSLERMVEKVSIGGEDKEDVNPLIEMIDAFLGSEHKYAEEVISEDIKLNVFEKNVLEKLDSGDYKGFHIKVTLEENCVLKSVRVFMVFRNLHSLGEVIKSIPDMQSIQDEKFDLTFSCIFISNALAANIKKNVMEVMEVKKVDVRELTLSQVKTAFPKIEEVGQVGEHLRKIQSIRVDVARLDKLMNLVEELAISKLRLAEVGNKIGTSDLKGIIESFSRLTDELQNEVMQARLVPVGQAFERFPRLVRDVAKATGKKVKFEMSGGDIELDRTVLDEIGDPLIHLLKNAVDHGVENPDQRKKAGKPEEGSIKLSAAREKSHVFIDVADDGFGMDVEEIKKTAVDKKIVTRESVEKLIPEEILLLTAHPGFSTKKDVTETSGRGVGLDVAKSVVENLGGTLLISSNRGKGTKVTLRLPVTTAVVQALLVSVHNDIFAIPISNVTEIIATTESEIKKIEQQETLLHRGNVLPLVRLCDMFSSELGVRSSEKLPSPNSSFLTPNSELRTFNSRLNVVIVTFGNAQFGVVVDRLISQQDIVIKQLTKELKGIKGFAGATILGDGHVALVLDVATLL